MYRGLISLMPKAQPLLLDLFPNASVAYSLRKLRTAYTGSAIRVRRSSDNAEQDFGFDNSGDLDVNSIENFVGWNLFAYSEQLQHFYWVKTNLTVTADSLVAPDGNTTGDILYETVTSGTHVMGKALAVIAGNEYTVSFWIRGQGRDNVRIRPAVNLSWDGVTAPVAWLNLATGTVVSQNAGFGGTVQMSPAPNGWYFVTYRVKAVANATSQMIELNLSPDGLTISYAGDVTKGIAVWGLQVTESSTLKTYQQTLSIAMGQGFVTKWYDQSGNGNDAFQNAILGSQAQIIANGHKIIAATTNKLTTTWTSDVYTLTTGINPNTRYLSIGVVNRTANTNNIAHIGIAGAFGGVNGQTPLVWFATTGEVRSAMFSSLIHGTNTSTGAFITTSEKNASDLKSIYINGTALATTATEATSTGTNINSFGQSGGTTTTCQYAEYIYWNSEQSANRVGIETEINNYYNVY